MNLHRRSIVGILQEHADATASQGSHSLSARVEKHFGQGNIMSREQRDIVARFYIEVCHACSTALLRIVGSLSSYSPAPSIPTRPHSIHPIPTRQLHSDHPLHRHMYSPPPAHNRIHLTLPTSPHRMPPRIWLRHPLRSSARIARYRKVHPAYALGHPSAKHCEQQHTHSSTLSSVRGEPHASGGRMPL